MYVFLHLNGWELDAEETEVVATLRSVAAGEMGEDDLAGWLRLTTPRRAC